MKDYVSSIVFEIVNGAFIYRGWDVRSDHIHHEETPQLINFGQTGILLRLVGGEPKLDVPEGQGAKLLHSDHALKDGEYIKGRFVEIQIH